MATSKMKIKKVCEWCGTTFYAQKLTTRFCSHRCNNLAYKEAVRQKRIQEIETKVQTVISEQPISDFKDKEYLSFKEAATLLGLSKQAVYKWYMPESCKHSASVAGCLLSVKKILTGW